MKFSSFLVVLSVILGIVWVSGQAILFTAKWVPWMVVFHSIPLIVVTFVVANFVLAMLTKSEVSQE